MGRNNKMATDRSHSAQRLLIAYPHPTHSPRPTVGQRLFAGLAGLKRKERMIWHYSKKAAISHLPGYIKKWLQSSNHKVTVGHGILFSDSSQ